MWKGRECEGDIEGEEEGKTKEDGKRKPSREEKLNTKKG